MDDSGHIFSLSSSRNAEAGSVGGKLGSLDGFLFIFPAEFVVLIDAQVSRRQGVGNLSSAVRYRTAQTLVLRRFFRDSAATLESSDPPSGDNGTGSDDSPESASKPRWGGVGGGRKWGGIRNQPSITLNPAEQTIRDGIIKKKQEEGRQRQEKEERERAEEERQREEEIKKEERKRERQRRLDDQRAAGQGQSYTNERRPFNSRARLQPTTPRDDMPPRQTGTSVKGWRLPMELRKQDWQCQKCGRVCYGKYLLCPFCLAERPNLPTGLNPHAPEAWLNAKEAESGRRGYQGKRVERSTHSRGQTFSRQAKDTSADVTESEVPRSNSYRENVAGESAEAAEIRKQKRAAKKAPQKPSQDVWTWDPSSLNLSEVQLEEQQPSKDVKRRPSRKQRSNDDEEDGGFDEYEDRRRREDRKRMKKERSKQKEVEPSPIFLPEFISVSSLADVIGVRPAQFVERMENMGFEGVTYDHILDAETAGLIAVEYNFDPIFDTAGEDLVAAPEPDDPSSLPRRPPVVTIMGHVDHGKTTILDWLRSSSIAASEHGGITQHIGAFSVGMPSGQIITFLDTPGHAAFQEMRRRGADVTDIVILVVAADDSVKPQTVEAIKHATGARVPIVVAISKVDKEGRNIDKVKQDLSVHGVHVEDYGGDVQAIGVSGKTGEGMLELEEAIVTLSEMLDHRADTEGNAEGWVIESTTKNYGRVTSALMKRGTLRPGDVVVAGTAWARVRTLRNEAGIIIEEAKPGMPVEIDGWREQPVAGTEMLQAPDEQIAKDVVEFRLERTETQKLGEDTTAINQARRELVERRRQEDAEEAGGPAAPVEDKSGPKAIHFIVKGDVDGSAEAVLNSVTSVGNNEVYANVLRSAVGPISEFDIEHAASARGCIITFNMPVDHAMLRMAEQRGVKVLDHNVIYKLIDDVKELLSEHLAPSVSQRVTGEAEIGQVFEISVKGREKAAIAGCKVRNGMVQRAKNVRVLRGQEIIYDGMYRLSLLLYLFASFLLTRS